MLPPAPHGEVDGWIPTGAPSLEIGKIGRMFWRVALIGLAAVAAATPIPAEPVERFYSEGIYPELQRTLTTASNRTQFAWFDIVVAGVVLFWFISILRDLIAARDIGLGNALARTFGRTLTIVAALYLAFLVTWGLNYRRTPLGDRLELDLSHATPEAAGRLARIVVGRLNALHADAHAGYGADDDAIDAGLELAFERAQKMLNVDLPAQPARPKHTVLDLYFRTAGVDGMTAPFFAETLVPSDLLEMERPAIIAHEWSHLAGFADEGEASFLAWVVCLEGSAPIEYSGWLSLYGDALRAVPREEQERVMAGLAAGPVADIRAMADRRRRNVNESVSRAGWRAYDQYLRANRVESGTASYGEVIRFVLGTELGRRAWQRAD